MTDISVDLVSQEKKVWAGSARSISAPSVNGQIGIWAGHTPLMAVLQPGHVSLIAGDGTPFDFEISKAVNSQITMSEISGGTTGEPEIDNAAGFLSVDGNLVTVVADVITQLS